MVFHCTFLLFDPSQTAFVTENALIDSENRQLSCLDSFPVSANFIRTVFNLSDSIKMLATCDRALLLFVDSSSQLALLQVRLFQ